MALSRRGLLGTAVLSTVSAPVLGAPAPAGAEAPGGAHPSVLVRPDDPRYAELTTRGYNGRFAASPDEVCLVYSAEHVERAVEAAVRAGRRVTVRSGGHCFEGLVDDPAVRVLLDVSEMKAVDYDPRLRAFAVEAGATLGELYRALYLGWGVTVPGGLCVEVGVGGHIAGGGYGPLSRRHGLSVDHLWAVEVVVVDRAGRARTVVATREPDDPNRDLWWAHTGGGGGNFGVVTRYWFRTPGATGTDPARLLPRPPARLLTGAAYWSWNGLTEAAFTRLVKNHGAWHAAHSGPDSPYAAMHSTLYLQTLTAENIMLQVRMDATVPDARRLLDEYVAAVGEGVGAEPWVTVSEVLWMENTLAQRNANEGFDRSKSKGGYLRKPYTDAQVAAVYRALTEPTFHGWGLVYLASYGCRVNTVAPDATAVPQRDSIFKTWYAATWGDPAEDALNIDWVRRFYRDVYAATGGVPAPNDNQDGCFINYPDVDVKDPAWNTSGIAWQRLYYKENYPRLQRVKARYDPGNVFRHALSIEPGAS
jgi:hypothetical protein